MSGQPFERLGKVDHPDLGKCVKVRTRSWDGRRYEFCDSIVPLKQTTNTVLGYDPDTGQVNRTFSRSVSYNDDLRKYAQARYPRKGDTA